MKLERRAGKRGATTRGADLREEDTRGGGAVGERRRAGMQKETPRGEGVDLAFPLLAMQSE